MEVGKLTVSARDQFGKGPSRRYRAQGLVPGICYGHGLESPLPIVVSPRALRAALDPVKKRNTVIQVTVENGQGTQTLTAMLKDAQIHPLRREIEHVDLIAIDTTKPVEVEVPIELTGKAKGVVDGGILNVVLRRITVVCTPDKIPTEFKLDVTNLEIGDVFHISDIDFPEGVEPGMSPKLAIVTCVAPREEEGKGAGPAEAAEASDAAPADKKDEGKAKDEAAKE
ncbi:MAG: 50S ribosomal protein L25 [Deltaproteobacteria bacterium]|nr:MAG: 50S ribosomal protein L25 [Deltaproteobacteria bacterium]